MGEIFEKPFPLTFPQPGKSSVTANFIRIAKILELFPTFLVVPETLPKRGKGGVFSPFLRYAVILELFSKILLEIRSKNTRGSTKSLRNPAKKTIFKQCVSAVASHFFPTVPRRDFMRNTL